LRSKANTLQGKDATLKARRSPFGLSASAYRSKVINEFEKLLIEATPSLNAERHEGVTLRLYFLLPFVIFELVPWSFGVQFA
jgi:hypothetical protein